MLTHEYLYVLAVLFFALSSNYVLICALMQFVENKSFHFRIIALIYIYVTCPKYLFLEFFRTFLHSSHLKKQCILYLLCCPLPTLAIDLTDKFSCVCVFSIFIFYVIHSIIHSIRFCFGS